MAARVLKKKSLCLHFLQGVFFFCSSSIRINFTTWVSVFDSCTLVKRWFQLFNFLLFFVVIFILPCSVDALQNRFVLSPQKIHYAFLWKVKFIGSIISCYILKCLGTTLNGTFSWSFLKGTSLFYFFCKKTCK